MQTNANVRTEHRAGNANAVQRKKLGVNNALGAGERPTCAIASGEGAEIAAYAAEGKERVSFMSCSYPETGLTT